MCGRFIILANYEDVFEQLRIEHSDREVSEWVKRYNLAPTQEAPVFLLGEKGRRELKWLRWGLIPSFAKDPAISHRMINARSETVAEKPAFRDSFQKRRCFVVSNGFYEWKREGREKQPYWIRRRDQGLVLMAGVYDSWTSPFGEIRETFSILTKEASPLIQSVHDRMPVMYGVEKLEDWLISKNIESHLSDDDLEMVPIHSRVNSPSVDDVSVLSPPDAKPPEQMKLF